MVGNLRSGSAAYAGYLGTAYNPFIIDGAAPAKGGKGGSLRVRGITLPNGFTLGLFEFVGTPIPRFCSN